MILMSLTLPRVSSLLGKRARATARVPTQRSPPTTMRITHPNPTQHPTNYSPSAHSVLVTSSEWNAKIRLSDWSICTT